ncbi:dTDP-4-dehydrorhamnose reductase [Candidatus Galacturonibacter soehngenii]|uniref:dTDP-4-dehydrorhamnose reductase n=1 Tax=Candidatus Galacturonatibacter soehngenii TaxID=2307010 RepID=A0A7V7QKE7_9FIRM|nr:dTDP-4-dehydrorhamnose reductase [Candidatus Galacturonibacter soehngenii]KAB1438265.1 dTDP-4-dehydrorhamnose reductase [Candidatus Galacturonibacter soehngenii]
MKKLLITGCNGQLGRAINKQYENTDYELVNTDVAELDITNVDAVVSMMKEVKPYAIINCAAHTGVDACETDQDNAYRINAIGPRNLSIAATQVGAKMIHISTDYVFEGNATKPYTEFDTVNPQGMYGFTKLAGENFVKEFAKDYFIIRTAWLYGDGKNFVKTMLRLSETNDKVRVVGDQFGSPTSASELAKMIAHLVPTQNYGLFHGTCEGACSWADFAKEIFRLAGKKTVVEAITTAEYPTPAVRPAYSVLDNYMLKLTSDFTFASWEEAIKEYMLNY